MKLKLNFKRTFLLIVNIAAIYFIAYVSKYIVITEFVGKIFNHKNYFLYLTFVKNSGAAFGLFEGSSTILFVFAVLVVLGLLLYVLLYKFYLSKKKCLLIAILCAGILGNAFERLAYGYVIDFIKINLWNIPVFNINDMMITITAFILIMNILIKKKDDFFNDREVEEDIYLDLYK